MAPTCGGVCTQAPGRASWAGEQPRNPPEQELPEASRAGLQAVSDHTLSSRAQGACSRDAQFFQVPMP